MKMDSGSNYDFSDKQVIKHPDRSAFTLDHLHDTTMFEGELVPIWWRYTLPDSMYKVSLASLIRMQAMVAPLMSRKRILFHLYHIPLSIMWKGSHNFFNTAMNMYNSGTSIASLFTTPTMPRIRASEETLVTRHSLANYLGLPAGFDLQDTNDIFISALPFFAYKLIRKHYETNRLLCDQAEQKKWYTQDESAWRLPVSGFSGTTFENPEFSGSEIDLLSIETRYFADDYFQSARPWLEAGNPPSLSFSISRDITIPVSASSDLTIPSAGVRVKSGPYLYSASTSAGDANAYFEGTGVISNQRAYTESLPLPIPEGSLNGVLPSGSTIVSSLTGAAIRQLFAMTEELERATRTDGTYTEYIQSFFGVQPSHADKFKPIYVGGSYAPIAVSEVLQTSSPNSSSDTPLGHSAGHGISSSSNFLGSFTSNDFGIVMILASVLPDTMYCQGIPRKFSYQLESEFPLPTRTQLSPQAIKNKELYAFGNEPNGVFAYQDIFDEWRSEENVVSGYLSDPEALSYFPYTQVRYFDSQPTFEDNTFRATQANLNQDYLTAPEEPPFICQFDIRCTAVEPLPYRALPKEFI